MRLQVLAATVALSLVATHANAAVFTFGGNLTTKGAYGATGPAMATELGLALPSAFTFSIEIEDGAYGLNADTLAFHATDFTLSLSNGQTYGPGSASDMGVAVFSVQGSGFYGNGFANYLSANPGDEALSINLNLGFLPSTATVADIIATPRPFSFSFYNLQTGASVSYTGTARQASIDGALFVPVPEPATWALMLLGFGGVGATIRRRRLAYL